jgi:hypothetical protein
MVTSRKVEYNDIEDMVSQGSPFKKPIQTPDNYQNRVFTPYHHKHLRGRMSVTSRLPRSPGSNDLNNPQGLMGRISQETPTRVNPGNQNVRPRGNGQTQVNMTPTGPTIAVPTFNITKEYGHAASLRYANRASGLGNPSGIAGTEPLFSMPGRAPLVDIDEASLLEPSANSHHTLVQKLDGVDSILPASGTMIMPFERDMPIEPKANSLPFTPVTFQGPASDPIGNNNRAVFGSGPLSAPVTGYLTMMDLDVTPTPAQRFTSNESNAIAEPSDDEILAMASVSRVSKPILLCSAATNHNLTHRLWRSMTLNGGPAALLAFATS